ncbi:FtsX-like permease family protein [Gorillibacterium massiliense]|uniref:FtsX-like permease family protein n=1 Tax=Gorillibacterium massiliense TaxID=1280390 RepID=UPI0004B47101|nr:FtsX-like permease family protein [Gorillibacterium massiliense]
MNVMNRLTVRHMRLNKKRTLVTLFGVIISVAMLTAVASLGTSFIDLMKRSTIAETGDWHVLYNAVTSDQLKGIEKDGATAETALSRDIGYAALEHPANVDKPYLFVRAYSAAGFHDFSVDLIDGRLPSSPDEAVIAEHVRANGGQDYKIGDVLHLNVGQRESLPDKENSGKGAGGDSAAPAAEPPTELSQNSSLLRDSENRMQEQLVGLQARDYKIVGVIARPDWEPTWAPGYTVLSYVDEAHLQPGDTVDAFVKVNKITPSIFKHGDELAKELSISNHQYNSSLLRYSGAVKDDNLRSVLYSLMAIIMAIIMIGSISLIYNAFAISVSERSRHLGMLSSIGATRKQKRSSVFFEGGVIGLISIPLGLISGLVGIGITFTVINPILQNVMDIKEKFKLVVSPYSILLAVGLSIITIFVSSYIPARRASRISPIDAIRQTQDIRLTSRSVKTSKWTRKLFGFEAEVGLKNLKRNRRRYRATVFSLIISLILFLSVSSFTFYLQKSVSISQDNMNFDIQVSAYNMEEADVQTVYSHIENMDKVTEASRILRFDAVMNATADQAADYLKGSEEGSSNPDAGMYPYTVTMIGLTKDHFTQYAREAGVSPDSYFNGAKPAAIVIDAAHFGDPKTRKYIDTKAIHLKTGTILPLLWSNPETSTTDRFADVSVGALTDKLPMGVVHLDKESRFIAVMPMDTLDALRKSAKAVGNLSTSLYLKSGDPIGLQNDIEKWRSNQSSNPVLTIWNVYKSRQQDQQMMTIMSIFTYGFVSLITAISVSNIFNTISTSISLRKREFAMLRSVGMTPKGFNKMIRFESLFYGIKALLYGLPLSFGAMLLLYKALSGSFSFRFTVPWGSVGIAVLAVFLVVGASMLYSGSKVRKENILDGLRTENI